MIDLFPPEDRLPVAEFDEAVWLGQNGFPNRIPHIRSTMAGRAIEDPFQFLLIDRLGIVPALAYSQALNRGSWFHECARLIGTTECFDENHPELNRLLDQRLVELNESCARFGVIGDYKADILENERRDSLATRAWMEAYQHIPIQIGQDRSTFPQYFNRPYWGLPVTTAGEDTTEALISIVHPRWPSTPLTIQADRLLYHRGMNKLWLVDYKTTAAKVSDRLQTCPIEFQSRHYMIVLKLALANNWIQPHLLVDGVPLPASCELGGIIHIGFRKPQINFGMKDRSFTLDTSPFKSGPRKGQPRNEKVYEGEPVFANYLARVKDWCAGRGDYADTAAELATEPNVNMSFTYPSALDARALHEYILVLNRVYSLSTCPAIPAHFYRTLNGAVMQGGAPSDYAPFHYARSVRDWPEIMQKGRYFINPRQETPLQPADFFRMEVL